MGWMLLVLVGLGLAHMLSTGSTGNAANDPEATPPAPEPESLPNSHNENSSAWVEDSESPPESDSRDEDAQVRPEDDPYYCTCGCGHYMQGD